MKTETKKLNLRTIARLAESSKSTVSRVLTNHPNVAPKTRARIEAVIKKQKFQPNVFARALAGGRTGLVAVLASEMNSGFFAEVIKGINQIAQQHACHLLSSFAHSTEDYIHLWKEFLSGGRADAVILIAPPLAIYKEKLEDVDFPSVLCSSRPLPDTEGWGQMDSVTVNNRAGIHEILNHLVLQGRTSILHLAGPSDIYDASERRRAFEEYCAQHPKVRGEVLEIPQSCEGGQEAMAQRLKKGAPLPNAVVAVNDLAAIGALSVLRDAGLRIPGDMVLTGCDDDPSSNALGLTSLRMPMVEIGRVAATFLYENLENKREQLGPRHYTMDLHLEVRSSSLIPITR